MGTDNLFHKRKAKDAQDLARRKAKRSPYARILIVCEGKKTEPNYFNGLKDKLELNSANVEIVGRGATPTRIVDCAKDRYQSEEKQDNPFDHVYCVFDKDKHSDYKEAREKIRQMKPHDVFHEIASVPCFEYFLLLHYRYTAQPFANAKAVHAALKKENPKYHKNDKTIFSAVRDRLDDAINYAEKSLIAARQNNTDNPSTSAHKLVKDMRKIAKTPR